MNDLATITARIAKEACRIELLEEVGSDSDLQYALTVNELTKACIDLLKSLGRTPVSTKVKEFCERYAAINHRSAEDDFKTYSYNMGRADAFVVVSQFIDDLQS